MMKLAAGVLLASVVALSACSGPAGATASATASPGMSSPGADAGGEGESLESLFSAVRNNAPTGERIDALEAIAMHYYWYGGDLLQAEEEIFQGITLHGDYDVVAQAFAQAVEMDPWDVDLRYSLASAQVLQKKLPEAMDTYAGILALDPKNFNARLTHTVYSKVTGDTAAYTAGMEELRRLDPERAADFEARIQTVDDVAAVPFNTKVPDGVPAQHHAFVVLGYALSDTGEMEETLIERLKVAKAAADKYPDSLLIVTGGVPKGGITESDAMARWLTENGVAEDRIIKEGLATDTVENALFSLERAQDAGVESMTLISSASHMRRALVVFGETEKLLAHLSGSKPRDIGNAVYLDYPTAEEASVMGPDEEMVIMRDLMRSSGIWAFPGLQR
ncbi:YdcF family protein [Arthrobacter sp. zg-Y20]|uniref:ElyC/SanA/YdcF family protein n=1 Tax=unclassified Arthrobacter TaxID=235627 RepID=UPI001D14586A|nr:MULTISPECIES: ElyC/SanA/YdcF family protein [unclassified Arthrobacter]MCC3276649.1 YdcF family protein [Arthrobacter sp. zg-Y20]MDK1316808.1 ElyC/SanA/YdcF family protein [Arthrobacter sp. zg.Y20]WIB06777.1 ElyC/SanA/YdcF family protein [Arthrobacter sp. zg-Y20]